MLPKLANNKNNKNKIDTVIFFSLEENTHGEIVLLAKTSDEVYEIGMIDSGGLNLDANIPVDFGLPVDKQGRMKIIKQDWDAQQR